MEGQDPYHEDQDEEADAHEKIKANPAVSKLSASY